MTLPGSALLLLPKQSLTFLEAEVVGASPSEPVAWFVEVEATCSDSSNVNVLLRFDARQLKA